MTQTTSWGGVAGWYDDLLESNGDTYQEKVIAPNLIRMAGMKAGEHVLDLACGQGFFARKFHELGAKVTGSDIARELIDYACKHSPPEIQYVVSPADNLSFLGDESVDVVTIVLALQNIENLDGVIRETSRVLRERGRMYLVLNHPAFRIPKASSWGYDERANVQYRRMDRYLSDSRIKIEMNPGAPKKLYTTSFHRSLQTFAKHFSKHGLCISRMEEWISDRTSDSGPRADAENRSRKEFPLFLTLELRKLPKA